jgi:Metallo-beta-lactamase superfamily
MTLHLLPSGNADAIILRFQDEEGKPKNICVDSGFRKTYKLRLKKSLLSIQARGEKVDLWIITHIDQDHISGILAFLKDIDFPADFVTEFWFNPSMAIIPDDSEKISVQQGIKLRDYLIEQGKCPDQRFTSDLHTINRFGAKITILSPDGTKLDRALAAWDEEERKAKSAKPIAGAFDYDFPIEDLMKTPFKEDTGVWNGSSIAFLFEGQGKRILFLGDGHPSVVAENLFNKFKCSEDNPLKLDLVKVSHHGSAGNTSPDLLNLFDCNRFAFCAAGSGFPAKETLVRIAASRLSKPEQTVFLFNDETPRYKGIFRNEPQAAKTLNFRIEHLPNGFYEL